MSIRKVVVGIVFMQNGETKFLVLHRKLGWEGWEFPKGGIERKDMELEELALKRELKEETGLESMRIVAKLPFVIRYKYPKQYSSRYRHSETEQQVYLVRSFQKDVKTILEHDAYKWLSYEEARKTLTHDNQKKALDVAWKHLKEMKSK